MALVSSIAAQTNFLALNAIIEASLACKAGHGFSVVALEVNELAGQIARVTEQIDPHLQAAGRLSESLYLAARFQ